MYTRCKSDMGCTDLGQASCNCIELILTTQISLSTCKSAQLVNEYSAVQASHASEIIL